MTVTRKQLREILLETGGSVFRWGLLCNIKSEHLGAGVYRIRLTPKHGN